MPEYQDVLELAGAGNEEEGTTESSTPPPVTETMTPSSFGMTFCVDSKAASIQIKTSWGQYQRVQSEIAKNEQGAPKRVWKRTPIMGVSSPIPLKAGALPTWQIHPDFPEVVVQGQMRQQDDEDWIVIPILTSEATDTIMLESKVWRLVSYGGCLQDRHSRE
jgi:hypothetical protein